MARSMRSRTCLPRLVSAIGRGASVPLGELARNLYAMNSRQGRGGLDFSSVVRLVANEP